ncbi:MAG: DUF4175 family protein [Flavobacteriales bacterium]|nr:DUF4175 family protein [Flavobacteriales bacterium]
MPVDSLRSNLEKFIRKYHLNAAIRGVLIHTGLTAGSLLLVVLVEYWGWTSREVRTVLFFGYAAVFLGATVAWILLPLLRLWRLRPGLDDVQAARIVGDHFPEIRDRLLNALQLEKLSAREPGNSLLLAAIEQKRRQLSVFDFRQAVSLKLNKKYLPYALPPLGVLIFLLLAAPRTVVEPAWRITRFRQEFQPPPPFEFVVQQPLQTEENRSFTLRVETRGASVPDEMHVETGEASYRMASEKPGQFYYEFRVPRQDVVFRLRAGKYVSQTFVLDVLKKAALVSLKVSARYPVYTGLVPEIFDRGDLTVPEGTRLDFSLALRHTRRVFLTTETSTSLPPFEPQEDRLTFSYTARKSLRYGLVLEGHEGNADTLTFELTVIPDQQPNITVEEKSDSLMPTLRAFRGEASDDYGLRSLIFQYEVQRGEGEKTAEQKIALPLSSGARFFAFTHAMDFSILDLKPGDEVSYAFTVCDNDAVNGSKCASTPRRVLRVPTLEEQLRRTEQADQSVMENLGQSRQQTDRLEKELNQLSRNLTEKRQADWQERKKVEDLLKMEENLRRQMEELKKDIEKANRLREQLPNDPTLEDRKLLEKQAEKLMSDELRRILEEIKRLLEDNADRSQMKDWMEQARETSLDLEKQLERLQELFKKLELESLMNAAAEKLEQLAREEKNEALKNQQVPAREPDSKAQETQKNIQDAFKNLEKDLNEMLQKNEQLEKPIENLENLQQQARETENALQKAMEKLQQGAPRQASENQKQAAEKMEEMARELRAQMERQRDEEQAEDAESIKRLLRNLLTLSFNQEKLMADLKQTSRNSPVFKDLSQKQRRLKDDARTVEDSLFALSKRQIRISEMVNKEMADIRKNMEKAIQRLADRDGQNAGVHQQYVMTGFNNLALMLSESLEQMQMSMKMKGGGSCSKPGASSEPSEGEIQKIKEMQKKLGEQMQKMAEQMKQGKDGQKPGDQQKPGSQGLNSREIAQMAAQQEMLRRKLREMAEKQGGLQQKRMLNDIQQQMEQNEYDLYNKRITEQSLMRQRDIMVRLLEFERAQRQQEQDEQRQSRSGEDSPLRQIPDMREWEKEKQRLTEILRTVPPGLKPYYREKAEKYLSGKP